MNTCALCQKDVRLVIKPYQSRGRFPNRTGALCQDCYEKLKAEGKLPRTKIDFSKILEGKKATYNAKQFTIWQWLYAKNKKELE